MYKNKQINFFIPHYGDHKRLCLLLELGEYVYGNRGKYIIYDSSPEPCGSDFIKKTVKKGDYIYEKLHNDSKENTYTYVLRDFCLSEHSADGAFILPNDEFIVIDVDTYDNIPKEKMFTAGKQISYEPGSKKLVEYSRALNEGYAIPCINNEGSYLPQYHATFIPGNILNSFGNFIQFFIDKWGNKNALFIDFVLFEILNSSNIFFSNTSVYIQEKLKKRKTAGKFVHPALFLKSLDRQELQSLANALNSLWKEIDLKSSYSNETILKLLSRKEAMRSLIMPNINNHQYLFQRKKVSENNPRLSIEHVDIFNAYHCFYPNTSPNIFAFYFPSSCLKNGNVLGILNKILDCC